MDPWFTIALLINCLLLDVLLIARCLIKIFPRLNQKMTDLKKNCGTELKEDGHTITSNDNGIKENILSENDCVFETD